MASQTRQPEFVIGEVLTFSGVVDAAIKVIDNYARWEVLVSLQQHIPFLAHPIIPLVLLVLGMILIQRSMRKTFSRSVEEAGRVKLHDDHGKEILPPLKLPSMMPTYIVIFSGVIMACVIALIWILTYSPVVASSPLPAVMVPIEKTKPWNPPASVHPSVPINAPYCPNGICPTAPNFGTQTVNNGPPPLELKASLAMSASDQPGLIKAIITVTPNQPVVAPTAIALEFDNPIKSMGWWIAGSATTTGGGPFRNGKHAMVSIGTSFSPQHALLLTIYSELPLTLLADPHLE